MKCPFCGSPESKVVDKRDNECQDVTRRRRECLKCSKRYTTYERLETTALTVVKKDGSREQFDREKLIAGVLKSCEKTQLARDDIEKIVNDVECELKTLDITEVPSKKIGELVMKWLKKKDKVAYIRFASVYREFRDLDDFDKELGKLLKR